MKHKKLSKKFLIVFSLVLLAAAVACSPTSVSADADLVQNRAKQRSADQVQVNVPVRTGLQLAADAELTESEEEGLLYMREEEKLAGDVYRYFYDLWDSAVFQNIAESEDTHTDAVLTLLDRYGIADPSASEPGVFSNEELQSLYDQLTDQGSQSLTDALRVGAAIEEIDILDLEEYMAQTDNADIEQVYKNLRNGSESHLRAFVRVLENQTGETYTPEYLSQEKYDEIMEGGNGAGGLGDGNSGQGAGQGKGQGSGQGTEQGTGRGTGQGIEQGTEQGTRQGNGQGYGRGKNS